MITEALLSKIVQIQKEQRMVVVHCSYTFEEEMSFCLSDVVILYDHGSSHKSQLLYKEGIDVPGGEKYMLKGQKVKFTLYFEPLPETCKVFNLSEWTNYRQPLAALEIHRRLKDEYSVELEMAPF